jgi:ribulose-phosphate 3-epimerase
MIQIHASLSCMDLLHVEQQMHALNTCGITGYHYDVVDGQFNCCLDFGDLMYEVFRKETTLPIDVHLACISPQPYINAFRRIGADRFILHYESDIDLDETISALKQQGVHVLLGFRCDTPVPDDFLHYAAQTEGILKLTVQPGFSGQSFQPPVLDHIREMRRQLNEAGLNIPIEADGNIHDGTIGECVKAGADVFTCGSSGLFKSADLAGNVAALQKAAERI